VEEAWRILKMIDQEENPKSRHLLPMNFFNLKISDLRKQETMFANKGLLQERADARISQATN